LALIIVNITFNLPFVVVIMRQAFIDIPIELEEAALVDGASFFNIFWKISLRLSAPSLVAALLIVIAFTWNEFLFALTIGSLRALVIPVQMAGAVDTRGIQFWFLAVRFLVAVTPPVVIALLAQRYIVRGLSFGAVKG
ncbi:MAG: carbohydrate ABC transporter permease, partial [Spirochaetes bacterium]